MQRVGLLEQLTEGVFVREPVPDADLRRAAVIGRRYRELALRGRATVVDDFGLDALSLQRYEPALEWLYHRYFRAETEGIEHVPDAGRALLVANRAGTMPWDSLMLSYAVRREHLEDLLDDSDPIVRIDVVLAKCVHRRDGAAVRHDCRVSVEPVASESASDVGTYTS